MPINVGTFTIDAVIIHDVPRNDGTPADAALTFSEAPMPGLDASRRNFFTEHISRSLSGRGFVVERDPDQATRVPQLVVDLLADPGRLVALSQDMARALYAAQNRVNNPGLLIVLVGRHGTEAAVSILKLQRHEGMRMQQTQANGRMTFAATILDDLTITDETRVFKASLFRADRPELELVEGIVSDDQRGYDDRIEVANFFLRAFLGCKLREASDVATKRFYDASTSFIESVPDPEQRLRYAAALIAELNRPATVVVPTDFAEHHLRTKDKQPYIQHLAAAGVPEQAIEKDTELIKGRLLKGTLWTGRKLRIIGPAALLDELVTYEPPQASGPGRIIITDTLQDFRPG